MTSRERVLEALNHEIPDRVPIDLGGQRGPLFNPEIYRSRVKPRHKALAQHIRSKIKANIWYHTCGSCATDTCIPVETLQPKSTHTRSGC